MVGTRPADVYEMETLRKKINQYESEINQLKNVVEQLSTENTKLKSKYSGVNFNIYDEPLWGFFILFTLFYIIFI